MRLLLRDDRWWANPLIWLEWFLIVNLAFLAVDIAIAHAINAFAHPAEWIPIGFSIAATMFLLIAIALAGPDPVRWTGHEGGRPTWRATLARWLGLAVGWGAIAVGIAGLVLHLNSDFFQEQTIKNLVYTAPFSAPLAYTGLGLVILLNRMVDSRSREWWRWVLLLAAGGFAGNFVLSLADHAQNGFFYPTEWIGVVAGAVGVGFLTAGVAVPESRSLMVMNAALMVIQSVVGVLGFYLHARGNLVHTTASLWDSFLFGAPVFAPLLFADVAMLALFGLWAQAREAAASSHGFRSLRQGG